MELWALELEVEALTPQDRPVQAQGTWTVYRLTYPIGEKEKAEKLVTKLKEVKVI